MFCHEDMDKMIPIAEKYFGIKVCRQMDCGGYGKIFELKRNNEKILKITSDRKEVKAIHEIFKLRSKRFKLPAFPIYYGISSYNLGIWHFILREKVRCPCVIPLEHSCELQNIAYGLKINKSLRSIVRESYPKLVKSLQTLNRNNIILTDIRMDNIGYTLKGNKYRDAKELVIFDFQLD